MHYDNRSLAKKLMKFYLNVNYERVIYKVFPQWTLMHLTLKLELLKFKVKDKGHNV